ncbi:MAG: zf-HC2 domain-containing protein [Myxococcales bacterium]|nr:zf-HC2 domain-containing protein [Myxococcales bacterium]
MSHRRVRARLSPYLEGDLTSSEELRVAGHVAHCAECADELDALRNTVSLLRDLPRVDPPPEFTERLMARVAAEGAPTLWGRIAARWEALAGAAWLAPAAATALGLGVFSWIQAVDVTYFAAPPAVDRPVASVEPPPAPRSRAIARADTGFRGAAVPRLTASAVAPPTPGRLPGLAACLPGAPSGRAADAAACAAWSAWLVGMALDDAPGFLAEVESVPGPRRDAWMRELTDFAARSGSAPLVGRRLRSTPDPRARVVADQFERAGTAAVRRVRHER